MNIRVFIQRLWPVWAIEALVIAFMVSIVMYVWVWLPLIMSSGIFPFIAGWRIHNRTTSYVMGAVAGMSLAVVSVIVQVGELAINGSVLNKLSGLNALEFLEALVMLVVLSLLPQAIFGAFGVFVHGKVIKNA